MGIFNFSFASDRYTDKGFDKEMDSLEKSYKQYKEAYRAEHLPKIKMERAYCHESVKSAFWWYENCTAKPNTGSKLDTELLHVKFKHSLESHTVTGTFSTKTTAVDKETQEHFVSLVLPNVDYMAKGYQSKEHCVKKIMEDYEAFKQKKNNFHASPFVTSTYWLLLHFNEDWVTIDADGKKVLKKDQMFLGQPATMLAKMIAEFLMRLEEKYKSYRVISMPN